MLSSLEIQNFKGIESGTISDLAQVNILVGHNNSGKSTILDALLLMRCAFSRQDFLGIDGMQQILDRKIRRTEAPIQKRVSYDELKFMRRTDEPLSLTAEFEPDGRIVQEWRPEQEEVAVTVSIGVDDTATNRLQPREHVSIDLSYAQAVRLWKVPESDVSMGNIYRLLFSHLLDTNSIRAPFLEKAWERIISDRHDRKLRDAINDMFAFDAEGFTLMPHGGHDRMIALLPAHGIPVHWQGDGVRYALNILAVGILLDGTVLMVEELESHQHPKSLKKLTQTLFELAKRQSLQLFLTTHSWELMTYALEAADEKEVSLTFHHTRLNEQGEFDARPIGRPDAKLLMDIGHDIRFQDKYIGAT